MLPITVALLAGCGPEVVNPPKLSMADFFPFDASFFHGLGLDLGLCLFFLVYGSFFFRASFSLANENANATVRESENESVLFLVCEFRLTLKRQWWW